MVVKVGGMCWVMSTGKRSITEPSPVTSVINACGPPVEDPIRSTFGACAENERWTSDCAGADGATGAGAAGRATGSRASGAGLVDADGGPEDADFRRSLAPRWRIFWIRS